MAKEVIIIGGGIIGLCSAYYLQKEGHQVSVIDKSDISAGASFVNAGYIAPSHFIPLASPGIISKGIKWMMNSSSPFYVKPRLSKDLLNWFLGFKRSATKPKVEKAIPVLKDINLLGRDLFEDIKASGDFDFHYERNGLLMCCQTDKAWEEEWKVGQLGIQEGLEVENLSKEDVQKLEPNMDMNIKGAVYYKCDSHTTPSEFMNGIIGYLKANGVSFYLDEEVIDINKTKDYISKIITNKQQLTVDEIVLAAGSWSQPLAKKLGIKIPIEAGKGYRINISRQTGIQMPSILVEAKVAVTPMRGFTRFAGTMEIGGINHKINKNRVKAIAKAGESFYNGLKIEHSEIENATCGLRPCTPDGIPYIGRSSKCKNITIATGHAMMGWSLGPSTGKLVSEIISEKPPTLNLEPFNPDRRF